MSSRCESILALVCAGAAGCDADPSILVNVEGQATTIIELVPPLELTSARQGTYRWEIADEPEGGDEPHPEGAETATFQPDLRGTYLIERWLRYGVGEDLTHRFVVEVWGAAPFARARAASLSVPVQSNVVVDGTDSSSPERRPLMYHWRLVERPFGSLTTSVGGAELTSFVPDVPGLYAVELSVFDGELWSELPSVSSVTAY